MKHGSLFSGIGGFDLAAEWMGWENVFSCEKDDKANLVLEKRFPNIIHHRDIFELDGTKYKGAVDIISGGFPCQPFSLAGKRKGENDDRYLWPEMLRIIRESKPTYVVGENVFGLVNMEDGATLEKIYTDLESEGYEVESFIIPACAVQAWHRRDRIWICAYKRGNVKNSNGFRCNGGERKSESGKGEQWQPSAGDIQRISTHANEEGLERATRESVQGGVNGSSWICEDATNTTDTRAESVRERENKTNKERGTKQITANTDVLRSQEQGKSRRSMYKEQNSEGKVNRAYNDGIWSVEPDVGGVANDVSSRMDRYIKNEPRDIPRVAKNISKRSDRLKQLGNAIVPQVAYEIFKVIEQYDKTHM